MTTCNTTGCTPTDAETTTATNDTETRPTRTPRVETRATDTGLEIRFELPGATRDTIDLTVEDDELVLHARTNLTAPEGGVRSTHVEFRPADFRGRWSLPDDVTAEGATSALEHGVLTLTLPRRAPARHEIAIG